MRRNLMAVLHWVSGNSPGTRINSCSRTEMLLKGREQAQPKGVKVPTPCLWSLLQGPGDSCVSVGRWHLPPIVCALEPCNLMCGLLHLLGWLVLGRPLDHLSYSRCHMEAACPPDDVSVPRIGCSALHLALHFYTCC